MHVGVVGLGTMGSRIALRLAAQGHAVVAYDPVVEELPSVRCLDSAADVARQCEVLLSSVPAPADVERLYLGEKGVLRGGASPLVCADLSTIDPATAQRVGAALAAVDIGFLDAPVSGGPAGAEAGTLSVMVGGDADVLERARPVLADIAGRIAHLGPVGAGSTVKLANQLLVGVTTLAVMEAMTLGARAGIDLARMLEALSAGAANSFMLRRNVTEFLLPRQFAPAFAMRLLLKDLNLLVAEADRLGVEVASGQLARDLYADAVAEGLAGEDYAAIVKLIEERSVGTVEG